MAHRESVQNQDVVDFLLDEKFFYNVSASVGYGCPNKPNDVRLVQFFLNAVAPTFGSPIITVDGDYGGQTWRRIKNFQAADGINGYGVVSSVDGTKWKSYKTGNVYTIYFLNFYYRAYFPDFWNDPRMDPKFPKELSGHLWGPLPDLL